MVNRGHLEALGGEGIADLVYRQDRLDLELQRLTVLGLGCAKKSLVVLQYHPSELPLRGMVDTPVRPVSGIVGTDKGRAQGR